MLEAFAPTELDTAITAEQEHPKAPGMKYRHYAPSAPLTVYAGNIEAVESEILSFANKGKGKFGFFVSQETAEKIPAGNIIFVWGRRGNKKELAHNLFQGLLFFNGYVLYFVQLRIAKVNPILLLSTCSTYFLFPVKTGYPDQQKDQFQNQADLKKDHQKILHCHTAFRKISHLPPLFLNTIRPINHSFSSSCCTFNSGLSDINPRRSAFCYNMNRDPQGIIDLRHTVKNRLHCIKQSFHKPFKGIIAF